MSEKAPLEAQEMWHLTLDQLFELSLRKLRESLGEVKMIEAERIVHASSMAKDEKKV